MMENHPENIIEEIDNEAIPTFLKEVKAKIYEITDFSTNNFLMNEILGERYNRNFANFMRQKYREKTSDENILSGILNKISIDKNIQNKIKDLRITKKEQILLIKFFYDIGKYDKDSKRNIIKYIENKNIIDTIEDSTAQTLSCGLELVPQLAFTQTEEMPKTELIRHMLSNGSENYYKNKNTYLKYMAKKGFFMNGKRSINGEELIKIVEKLFSTNEKLIPELFLKYFENRKENEFDGQFFKNRAKHIILNKELLQSKDTKQMETIIMNENAKIILDKNQKKEFVKEQNIFKKKAFLIKNLLTNYDQKEKMLQPKEPIFSTGRTRGDLSSRLNNLKDENGTIPQNIINIILKKDKYDEEIDEHHMFKALFYLNALKTAEIKINEKSRDELEKTILKKLEKESKDDIEKGKMTFAEKKIFLKRKQEYESNLTEIEKKDREALGGGMIFKKYDFVQREMLNINVVEQGPSYPNCYWVGMICSILPLNFAEDQLFSMIKRKKAEELLSVENANYKVKIGEKRISVSPEERRNRQGVDAPEFIKILEIAFQKHHGMKTALNSISTIIKNLSLALPLLIRIQTISHIDINREDQINQRLIGFLPLVITGVLSMFGIIMLFKHPQSHTKKNLQQIIEEIKTFDISTTNGIIAKKGYYSDLAFEEMFSILSKEIKEIQSTPDLESIKTIYTNIQMRRGGNSVFGNSGTRSGLEKTKFSDNHFYGGISIKSFIDPHHNKKQIYDIDILDYIYSFKRFKFMKFDLQNMFL